MKKCCKNCIYCQEITFTDRMKRHIPDDYRLVKCWHDGTVHRKNKEQRGCRKYKINI